MAASEAKDQIGFSMGRRFALTGRKYAFLGRRADRFGIVLFIFFVRQRLEGMAYIPIVTVA